MHIGEVLCLLCRGDLFVVWAPPVAPRYLAGAGALHAHHHRLVSLLRHGLLGGRWESVFLGGVSRFSLVQRVVRQVAVEQLGFSWPKELRLVRLDRVRGCRLVGGRPRRLHLNNY